MFLPSNGEGKKKERKKERKKRNGIVSRRGTGVISGLFWRFSRIRISFGAASHQAWKEMQSQKGWRRFKRYLFVVYGMEWFPWWKVWKNRFYLYRMLSSWRGWILDWRIIKRSWKYSYYYYYYFIILLLFLLFYIILLFFYYFIIIFIILYYFIIFIIFYYFIIIFLLFHWRVINLFVK